MIIDNSNAHEYVENDNMDIRYKNVTELKYVPPNVTRLNCAENILTTLPELPNITTLSCHSNKLTTLPDLPKVRRLYCSGNYLTTLPELPNVKTLHCSDNNFNLFELFSNKNRTLNELELIAKSIRSKPFTTAVSMLKQGKRFSQVRLWLQDALIDSGEWKK